MTTPIQVASVTLSASAANIVRDLIQERELDNSYALRVYVSGKSCSGYQYGMALDNKPGETDSTFDSQGLKVLIDEVSMQYMAGATIDYVDDERGKGFLVDNPNAAPACSCGSDSCESGSCEN
jgi:iron-sulfur cluster assembly accessory protein